MEMFVDKVRITVIGGRGGDGAVAFHREKYVASGGPDGGDGGHGGSVVLRVNDNLTTLLDFRYKRKYTAPHGENGQSNRKTGKSGENTVIRVPRGTLIYDNETGRLMADMSGDEDFVAAHYNVTPESANVLGYTGVVQSGSSKTYRDVISYVKSHDLSQDVHYQWVADRVCLESYIDWFIAQAYVGNSDLDNVRFFASDDYDGKWRWILYDFDLTFYRNANPYSYLISTSAYYSDVSLLMRHLMKNASFRDLFLTQLGRQLKTTFSQENVLSVIDSLAAELEPEIPRERERWDMTTSGWKNSVEALRKFVRGKSGVSRTQEIINDVSSAMGLTQQQIQKYFG